MLDTQPQKFNKFQEYIFPIYKHELKKFVPMSFLMFCILFVYAFANGLKDIFILYNTNLWVGARPEETTSLISAIKLWYVLPSAVVAVIVFTALLNKFGPDKTFNITVVGFIIFYALYGFVLYPNSDSLILSEEKITEMVQGVPIFFRTFITCFANWPFVAFYVISELWGSIMISSLFWQFANRVTLKHEVTRFFGLFSLVSSVGTVIAGSTIMNYALNLDVHRVKVLMAGILITSTIILIIYAYINKLVAKDVRIYQAEHSPRGSSNKKKVSALEGIKILFKNPYLMLVSVLILSYGIAINFSEILMKAGMKEAFDKSQYAKMQGMLSVFTGIFASVVVLISANILRKFSWKVSALVTPLTFLIVGGIFLSLVLYKQFVSATLFGMSTVTLSAWVGIIHDALVRSVKYSLFDTTKSMAYIPLDEDTKTKGQAAVEMIGGRAGKAGSSAVQQIMISFPRTLVTTTGTVGGVLAYSPVIIAVFFATVITWTFAVLRLNVRYEEKIKQLSCEAA